MALNDILQHILEDAEARISAAKNDQRQRLASARMANERETDAEIARVRQTKEAKKIQMRERAESHSVMARRHAILKKKQELISQVYSQVIAQLNDAPDAKVEAFFAQCLERVKGEGVVHASQKHEALLKKLLKHTKLTMGDAHKSSGGFTVETDTEFYDFTFSFLVEELLRPQTEQEVLRSILPA